MKINNKQIDTPTFELITEVKRQINLKGIPKLNRILNKGDFAMIPVQIMTIKMGKKGIHLALFYCKIGVT